MDEIKTAFTSLVEAGKKDGDTPLTDSAKIETFQLGRDIRKSAKKASLELSKLSADEKDVLALQLGLELVKVLAKV